MKKLLLAVFVLGLGLHTKAQDTQKHEGRQKLRQEMAQQLGLSEDQKAKMKAEQESFRKKMQELQSNTALSAEQKAQARKELATAHKENLKAVLSVDQQKKFEELMNDRKQKFGGSKGDKGGRIGGRAGDSQARLQKMKTELNLTADQESKISGMNDALKNDIAKVQGQKDATTEQKRAQVKALMEDHRKNIEAVLTAEQQAKFQAMINERKGRRGVK